MKPVKKENDNYFVSMDFHLQELHKQEENLLEEIKSKDKYIRFLKDQNKELELQKQQIENNFQSLLKLMKDTDYEISRVIKKEV